jgi:hypothetical protein
VGRGGPVPKWLHSGAEGVLSPEGYSDALEVGRECQAPAGYVAAARTKRMTQQPGRPSSLPRKNPEQRGAGNPSPKKTRVAGASASWPGRLAPQENRVRTRVGQRQGETGAEADGDEGVGGPHTSEEAG